MLLQDSQGRTPLLLLLAAGRSEDALSLVQGSSDVGVSLAVSITDSQGQG